MNSFQKLRLRLLKPKGKSLQNKNDKITSTTNGKEVKRSSKDEDAFLFI